MRAPGVGEGVSGVGARQSLWFGVTFGRSVLFSVAIAISAVDDRNISVTAASVGWKRLLALNCSLKLYLPRPNSHRSQHTVQGRVLLHGPARFEDRLNLGPFDVSRHIQDI